MECKALPLVSVVMITYNQQWCIHQAIAGVIKQKVDFPIELIITDDASTDNTGDVVKEWQQRYPNVIRYYRNATNLGMQGNYLKAFKLCRGKYMAMCDADDYWFAANKLATQVAYMESHKECAITFHRVVNYYSETGVKSLSNGSQKADTTILDLSRGNYITNMSVMYRRELVDLQNLPQWMSTISLPDYAMHMMYAAHGSIHYFNRPMGVYRQNNIGAWSQNTKYNRLMMAYDVRRYLMDLFSDRADVMPGLQQATINILLSMISVADDEEKCRFAKKRLKDILPEITDEGISHRLASLSHSRTSICRRMLSTLRAVISRIVPVPKP